MRHIRGYTLIELLSVILITAILASLAVPLFNTLQKRIEALIVITRLENLINNSRNNALIHHRSLTICGSHGIMCDNNWSKGILLLQDSNRNGIVDGTDQILNYVPLNIKRGTLTWRGFGGSRIVIESLGTTFSSNGSFTYCSLDNDPLYTRQVVINRGGRVRTSRDTNHDGIHEDGSGHNLICP